MLLIGTNKEVVVINPKDASRKKSILILKTNKEEGLLPDMTKNFLFIELSKKTLNEMYILCNDIFFPLLTQNVQQPDTSELISKELMEKFHNFLSHFYVALGHTEGKTRLPEPSDEIFRNPNINDNEKTQICEGAIVMWIDLIRYILKQEPEHDFRNGQNPLPVSEINFWGQKSTDLNSILEQIKKKKISEILKFLEKQKSTYHDMFTQIQKDVEKAAKETDHNYKYLKCLKDSFEFLEGTSQKAAQAEFTDIVDEFVPIFHIIRKIWTENSYYAKPERLIVLIRKLCNVIIERGIEFVGQNPFNKIIDDPDKEIQVLDITRQIIQKFIDAYFQFKDSDSNSWQITRNVIFFRLDAFNDRIGDILNIAKSYSEFSKMRTKVIGGIKGEALGQTLIDIFNECTKEIKDFISEDYNLLDINDDTFKYI
jgi:dynein heavy chain